MSGWDAYDWARIVFGAFMIVMGLTNLMASFAGRERRADDWQLRYGDGGTDLTRARRTDRWSGFASIALGVDGSGEPVRRPGAAPAAAGRVFPHSLRGRLPDPRPRRSRPMSGWSLYHWAGAALAAMALLVGLFCLVRRPRPGEAWWSSRLHGVIIIVFGLIMLRDYVPITRSASITPGIIFLWYAFWSLFVVPRLEARRQEQHEEALAYLAARMNTYSPPAYDEERSRSAGRGARSRCARASGTSAPPSSPSSGAPFLALAFIPPR